MPPFVPVDLPDQDPELQQTPTDILADLAEEAKYDLFLFDTAVLGYRDMTEDVHGPICTFFDSNKSRYKMALYPRDHFKSSAITIGGGLQKAVRDPNKRIHIKNERADNAEGFIAAMQQHCLTNRRFRTLYGNLVPPDVRKVRWNANELNLLGRTGIFPQSTISASGVTSATTSQHYTDLIWDDPISENAVKEPTTMEEAWSRMKSGHALLARPETDEIWIVGTRWSFDDVYSRWMKHYGKMTSRLARGAIENGLPIFPQLISIETLDMYRAADPYLFSCNYMNNPRNVDVQNFDIRALKRWEFTDQYEDEIAIFDGVSKQVLTLVDVDKLDITVTVDLAPAETVTADRNAITVLGVEPSKGVCIVLEAWAQRCPPSGVMDKLFAIHERWHPRLFGIEAVAYQKAFKFFLTDRMNREGVWFPIKDLKALGKKETRIQGLQPMVRTSRLAVRADQQLLIQEMDDFPLGEHDDVLDSLSMHLQIAHNWFSPERGKRLREAENRLLRSQGIILAEDGEPEDRVLAAVRQMTERYGNIRSTNLYS